MSWPTACSLGVPRLEGRGHSPGLQTCDDRRDGGNAQPALRSVQIKKCRSTCERETGDGKRCQRLFLSVPSTFQHSSLIWKPGTRLVEGIQPARCLTLGDNAKDEGHAP